MTLADRLKIARDSIGKSQKDMASLCHASYRTWQGYEAGETPPTAKTIEALVQLGFNANWLLTGTGEMKLGEAIYSLAEGVKNGDTTGERAEAFDSKGKKADLSPVKAAAVSYIKDMTDTQVAEVMKYLVPQSKREILPDEELLQSLSPEGKARVRAALDAQIKEIDDESANNPVGLRPTGT